ncbi:hypothetical protein ACH4ZU_04380 [Streptomyces sp. NPDC020472]|uniref:Ribbon-helix-helix protein CopG domain-containing protein n=1 Tax=Streptomyces litmocidini TaxID=67318 RepID=A0ABW7UJ67_9ACTN
MAGRAAETAGTPAQVRLSRQDWADLKETMAILRLESTSDALREAIRLLHREARQIEAARNIARFYGEGGAPGPLLDGLVTEADLAAADAAEF